MHRLAHRTCLAIVGFGLVLIAACSRPPEPTAVAAPTIAIATPFPATPVRAFPTETITPPPVPSPIPTSSPTIAPRSHEFDNVDSGTLLAALFPDLRLSPSGDQFLVNGDPSWMVWVTSRVEGQFTQKGHAELAAVIANEAPGLSAEQAKKVAPWGSFLAVFVKRGGKLEVAQRSYLFPTEISPMSFAVNIDRATDFDHDGQDELLVTTAATRLGVASTAGFLYHWNDQAFVEIWSAPLGEDNTSTINQTQYYTSSSSIHFVPSPIKGMDEIRVDTTRVDYARDSQGLADLDRELARRQERRVFRWGGKVFVPVPTAATPLPPLPSPTP